MHFVVTSRQGPNWDPSKPMREQQGWDDHVVFINGLLDDGFMLLGGPLSDGTFSPAAEPVGDRVYRTMIVVEAADTDEVARRVEQDPWVSAGVLERTSIDRWDVLAGDLPPSPG